LPGHSKIPDARKIPGVVERGRGWLYSARGAVKAHECVIGRCAGYSRERFGSVSLPVPSSGDGPNGIGPSRVRGRGGNSYTGGRCAAHGGGARGGKRVYGGDVAGIIYDYWRVGERGSPFRVPARKGVVRRGSGAGDGPDEVGYRLPRVRNGVIYARGIDRVHVNNRARHRCDCFPTGLYVPVFDGVELPAICGGRRYVGVAVA